MTSDHVTPLRLIPAEPLRNERIVGCKAIIQEEFFEIRIELTKLQKRQFVSLLNLIRIGGDLSPYYRQGIGQDRDDLLMKHGVMHLHLGGPKSNALLYLLQYDSYVVLLCIDGHVYVDEHPVGKSLPVLDIKKAGKIVAEKRASEATLAGDVYDEACASLERLRYAARKRDAGIIRKSGDE